jgi:hypothetical protein
MIPKASIGLKTVTTFAFHRKIMLLRLTVSSRRALPIFAEVGDVATASVPQISRQGTHGNSLGTVDEDFGYTLDLL